MDSDDAKIGAHGSQHRREKPDLTARPERRSGTIAEFRRRQVDASIAKVLTGETFLECHGVAPQPAGGPVGALHDDTVRQLVSGAVEQLTGTNAMPGQSCDHIGVRATGEAVEQDRMATEADAQ